MGTLTSKGQVTIPKKIRDYLGLEAGSEVSFSFEREGEVVVRPVKARLVRRNKRRFDKLRGTLDTRQSTDELMGLLRGYGADSSDPGLRDGAR